jgi:hypothetical protein
MPLGIVLKSFAAGASMNVCAKAAELTKAEMKIEKSFMR